VQTLLNAQADVNAQGGYHGNALQAAAYKGSVEIVQTLLSAQADVNAQGGYYGNALQVAAYRGYTETVQTLLDARADVNAQGGEFGNALQAAAYGGYTETVQMLLDARADVNTQGGPYGSPLLAAVHGNSPDVVQVLLDAGADTLLADGLGYTPLHIASLRDMLHILHQFPQLTSAVSNLDKLSQSPLHLAVQNGHIKFALMLLDLGADPRLLDGYGRNIMDWAHGNKSSMHQIRDHCPQVSLTPTETQHLRVRRSVLEASDALLHSRLEYVWPLVQQLGRYFLFLDELDNARYLFQLPLLQTNSVITHRCLIFCEICKHLITESYFVCKICAHVDLCSACIPKDSSHHQIHPDQQHEIFEVPDTLGNDCQLTGPPSEQLRDFLRNLIRERSVPKSPEIEMESSLDSLPDQTFDKTSLASRAFFGPFIVVPSFLFVIIMVMLGYWYS
jgi:ankyrin repeat protein